MTEEVKTKNEEILKVARERYTLVEETEREIRIKALEDLQALSGDQWPAAILAARKLENRPSLVINKLPQFARQIKNDQKQNMPSVKVHPTNNKGNVETAKVLQGIIRHIEYISNSNAVYGNAFDSAVDSGRGYFRITKKYADPSSFNQELRLEKIDNPFTVYMDPFSSELDGSDMEYCQIIEKISPEAFKKAWPKAEMSKMENWTSVGEGDVWITKDYVRVADYYWKEYTPEKLFLLSNGESVFESDIEEYITSIIQSGQPVPEVLDERDSQKCTVKWVQHNGHEILDSTTWDGECIPVIPVYGVRYNINGNVIIEGAIRHAIDSQRMYNYMASTEAEAIALAPKAPYVIAEGQMEGYETQWAQANRVTQSYLPYKPTSIAGVAVPPPQRQAFEAATQAITQARALASEDIKATTGIYDASLGAKSNETSGVAIRGRQQQAQTSNFHFADNLGMSIRRAGQILIDSIPRVYDMPQAIRIVSDENEQEVIEINKLFNHKGKEVNYDLSIGEYDVTVDTGPSYQTKRQEAAQFMLDFAKMNPSQSAMISDLILKNMDVPGAADMAERLKKLLPPNLIDDKGSQEIPPQVKAQMEQSAQMIEQLTEKLKEKTEQADTKKLETESKERIEFKKLENDIVIEQMKLQGQASQALMLAEIKSIQDRLALLNTGVPIDQEPQEQQQNQNFNEAVPQGDGLQNEQLTGELSPGQSQE